MTRDDIIRMAREAGMPVEWLEEYKAITWEEFERFAALIEQHLISQGYRRCAQGQRETQHCALLEEAVRAEREACAKVVTDAANERERAALNAWAADRLARHGIRACLYPDCAGGRDGTICHAHCPTPENPSF